MATLTAVLGVPALTPPMKHRGGSTTVARGKWQRVKGGTLETRLVEVTDAAPGQKFTMRRMFPGSTHSVIRSVDKSVPLFNAKTLQPSPVHTRYVTVSQSFNDVKPNGDKLGGFSTGGMADMWPEVWTGELTRWATEGFKPAR